MTAPRKPFCVKKPARVKKYLPNARTSSKNPSAFHGMLTITPGTGAGQEMNGITGVIIGGTSMSGGSGTMVGTLIGVFIMSVLKTGLANCGLQAPWQTFLTGAVVIGAVLLDIARTKAANRVKKG